MTEDNPTNKRIIPAVSLSTAHTGATNKADAFGMRPMQQRAYARRGEQFLLIKSPPASGKSRALMFIALDKLYNQGIKQAIITVPERSIGGSFADEQLSNYGFWADWKVEPQWNLCNTPGADIPSVAKSKVKAVCDFLASSDKILVCTHATFRFAVDALGIEAFDGRLIAVDEFHHVSTSAESVLGVQLGQIIARGQVHIVAMTGSYFRGDAVAVLAPADEERFQTVTYTYYEQLNGYTYLKALDIGYFFYTGSYMDAITKVLDPALKTIVHIPNVNARESVGGKDGKLKDVEDILHAIGEWKGTDEATGFLLVERHGDKHIIRVADLVDDDDLKRSKVLTSLRDSSQRDNRDYVDIIVALGMAKEGFDWIWCEHALTIGYRNSLTEIVQIIGRATRDAPGKERTQFTNLIAEPDASQDDVVHAVNNTLKAIAASLLMEQVLAPRFDFTPKNAGPKPGFAYGNGGYVEGGTNIGVNEDTGHVHIEVGGFKQPSSPEAVRIVQEDLNEIIAAYVQQTPMIEQGLFDQENTTSEDLTQIHMGAIVQTKYPNLSAEDKESVRQAAITAMTLIQQGGKSSTESVDTDGNDNGADGTSPKLNTALIDGIRRFVVHVKDLSIDLIDKINPFEAAYSVLSKAMDEKMLRQVHENIAAKKANIPEDEARKLAKRAVEFKNERDRMPDINSSDAWERRLAEGVAAFARYKAQKARATAAGGVE